MELKWSYMTQTYIFFVFLRLGVIPFDTFAARIDLILAGREIALVDDNIPIDALLAEAHCHQAAHFGNVVPADAINMLINRGHLVGFCHLHNRSVDFVQRLELHESAFRVAIQSIQSFFGVLAETMQFVFLMIAHFLDLIILFCKRKEDMNEHGTFFRRNMTTYS